MYNQIVARTRHSKHAPLSYERLAILLATADGPIDKSRIYDAVAADSVGALVMKKSSLYRLISELMKLSYLESKGALTLTDKGWRTLQGELKRIEHQRLILKHRLHR